MSLKDEIKKSMVDARKKVAELQKKEEKEEIVRLKEHDAASKAFIPIKNALDALSEEFSENPSIKFIYKDYISTCYDIKIEKERNIVTDSKRYEISVHCDAFTEKDGFRFSYCLNIKEFYPEVEVLHKRFDEGKESNLLDKLMLILADYEANGYISPTHGL